MKTKLLNVLKIFTGPGNKAKTDQIIKVPKSVHNYLKKTPYARDVDLGSKEFTEEVINRKGKLKEPSVSQIKRLIRNMAKERNDKKTLDFLNKPNPAKKPNGKQTPSSFEREFNLDRKNALKQIDNQLDKLRKAYVKASPGIQKNIIREANRLKKKQNSIQKASFKKRVQASKETPLFDIVEDMKRTTTFMEDVVKNVSESKKIEKQLSSLRKQYKKAKNKSEQDAITKKAKNLLNQTTTYTQQDKSFALSSLANPEYGLATSRRFGGKSPRGNVPTREGKTLEDSKLRTTGDVEDEAASVKKGTEQLRGKGKLTPTEQKELQKQIQEYIGKGGKITKGKPSKGTAPDDTPGLRDSLTEAQTLLAVDAPPGFSPTNVEQKARDKLIEEGGVLRQLQKKKASELEIRKAQNKVIGAMQKLQEVRAKEIRKKGEDIYDLSSSQREELKIDEPTNKRKKGGRLRKRKPKRVVRGVGAAKRGYGKANYSNKMY